MIKPLYAIHAQTTSSWYSLRGFYVIVCASRGILAVPLWELESLDLEERTYLVAALALSIDRYCVKCGYVWNVFTFWYNFCNLALKFIHSDLSLRWLTRGYIKPLVAHFIATSGKSLKKILRCFLMLFRHKGLLQGGLELGYRILLPDTLTLPSTVYVWVSQRGIPSLWSYGGDQVKRSQLQSKTNIQSAEGSPINQSNDVSLHWSRNQS